MYHNPRVCNLVVISFLIYPWMSDTYEVAYCVCPFTKTLLDGNKYE